MSTDTQRVYVKLEREGEPSSASPPVAIGWRISAGENQTGLPSGGLSLCESVEEIPVRMLARFLGQKPFEVVADLLKMGVLVNADQVVNLDTTFKLFRHHGYKVERA